MPRLRCNPILTLKRCMHACVCVCLCAGTSKPQQRPCETKWLQWIKSERDLWINRGRSLVDWSDGQIDEPLPAEIGSWFALCIPSIPLSAGKVPSQRVADRRRKEGDYTHLLTQSSLFAGLCLNVYQNQIKDYNNQQLCKTSCTYA